jgi:hypothetical protein
MSRTATKSKAAGRTGKRQQRAQLRAACSADLCRTGANGGRRCQLSNRHIKLTGRIHSAPSPIGWVYLSSQPVFPLGRLRAVGNRVWIRSAQRSRRSWRTRIASGARAAQNLPRTGKVLVSRPI